MHLFQKYLLIALYHSIQFESLRLLPMCHCGTIFFNAYQQSYMPLDLNKLLAYFQLLNYHHSIVKPGDLKAKLSSFTHKHFVAKIVLFNTREGINPNSFNIRMLILYSLFVRWFMTFPVNFSIFLSSGMVSVLYCMH